MKFIKIDTFVWVNSRRNRQRFRYLQQSLLITCLLYYFILLLKLTSFMKYQPETNVELFMIYINANANEFILHNPVHAIELFLKKYICFKLF